VKRAALERPRTVRTWRGHLGRHAAPVACACELQPGRFRKAQRIGGCNKSRCWLCHGDKLAGLATPQDRRGRARLFEGLIEVGAA
jgi:hypothetical protein